MIDHYLTAAEVAAVLQISYEGALDYIKHSGIPYVRIGRQYRVSETVLQEFLISGPEEKKPGKKTLRLKHKLY